MHTIEAAEINILGLDNNGLTAAERDVLAPIDLTRVEPIGPLTVKAQTAADLMASRVLTADLSESGPDRPSFDRNMVHRAS